MIVMELAKGGELGEYLEKTGKMTEEKAKGAQIFRIFGKLDEIGGWFFWILVVLRQAEELEKRVSGRVAPTRHFAGDRCNCVSPELSEGPLLIFSLMGCLCETSSKKNKWIHMNISSSAQFYIAMEGHVQFLMRRPFWNAWSGVFHSRSWKTPSMLGSAMGPWPRHLQASPVRYPAHALQERTSSGPEIRQHPAAWRVGIDVGIEWWLWISVKCSSQSWSSTLNSLNGAHPIFIDF